MSRMSDATIDSESRVGLSQCLAACSRPPGYSVHKLNRLGSWRHCAPKLGLPAAASRASGVHVKS